MTRKPVTEVPDMQVAPGFWPMQGTESRKKVSRATQQWLAAHVKKTKINPEYSDDYFKRRKP